MIHNFAQERLSVMDLLKAQQISDDESFQYLTTTD